MVSFSAEGCHIRFVLAMPKQDEELFWKLKRGRRTPDKAYHAWEQACRSLWRSLLLCIKAKLEAVDSGIEMFEDAFMANIVLPDGRTVGELMQPQIDQAYISGGMPQGIAGLLPAPRNKGQHAGK